MTNAKDLIVQILRKCEVSEQDIYDDNFIEHDILESLQIAEIIMELEDVFGIEIDGEDVIPENFVNVKKIEEMIIRYTDNSKTKKRIKEEIMWDMIARSAVEDNIIQQAGWKSSFTGRLFSEEEMKEYGENVIYKLKPYIHKDSTVVEIGIGSGITARYVAPYVKEYIGIDISGESLKRTQKQMESEGYTNIKFLKRAAQEIDTVELQKTDIVIFNSIIQYFNDYQECQKIIKKTSDLLINGIIFVGDVLDIEKKEEYLKEIEKNNGTCNKSDLWYSREFMRNIAYDIPCIKDIFISDKEIWTIQNEMTKYRYDVIYKVGEIIGKA